MNDITPKEAIANLNHIYGMVAPDIQRSLDVAIKALERPTGDCISREALKEAISTYDKFACLPDTRLVPFYELPYAEEDYVPYVHLADIVKAIDNAPPVEAFTKEDMAGAYNEGYACGSRENTRPNEQIAWEQGYEAGLAQGKQDRPQGVWTTDEKGYFYCDKCGKYPHDQYSMTNFCPTCGADMRGDNK